MKKTINTDKAGELTQAVTDLLSYADFPYIRETLQAVLERYLLYTPFAVDDQEVVLAREDVYETLKRIDRFFMEIQVIEIA